MDQNRFDAVTRSLASRPSRRHLLRGLTGLGLGLGFGAANVAGVPEAKKRRKKKPKKAKPNAYGCLNAGQPCRGNGSLCCSGVCQGKKPKKGKKDTSRCVGHNAGICTLETDSCDINVEVPCGDQADRRSACTRTTGNAAFCADISAGTTTHCRVCAKDMDCQAEFGPGAACVVLGGGCAPLCPHTRLTACVPPATEVNHA